MAKYKISRHESGNPSNDGLRRTSRGSSARYSVTRPNKHIVKATKLPTGFGEIFVRMYCNRVEENTDL